MKGEGIATIRVVDERRVETRRVCIGASAAVIGKEGLVATGSIKGDSLCGSIEIEKHIMAKIEGPAVAMIERVTIAQAIVVAFQTFINTCPTNVQVSGVHQQIAVGDVDLQFHTVVDAQGNVRIEGQ